MLSQLSTLHFGSAPLQMKTDDGQGHVSSGIPTRHVEKGFPGEVKAKHIESCPVLFANVTQTFCFGCEGIQIAVALTIINKNIRFPI